MAYGLGFAYREPPRAELTSEEAMRRFLDDFGRFVDANPPPQLPPQPLGPLSAGEMALLRPLVAPDNPATPVANWFRNNSQTVMLGAGALLLLVLVVGRRR